jgi:hypothetical protein
MALMRALHQRQQQHKGKRTMQFRQQEIQDHLDDWLQETADYNGIDWIQDNIDDLHHECFNTDYYIIGRYQAEQWLGNNAFQVINTIKEYEQDNFGEVSTDFSDPEKVVNMYVYIIGELIIHDAVESFIYENLDQE